MIHMVKLCVGVSSVEELESYRDQRAHWWGADYGEDVHVHHTRMMPKRGAEMEGMASIYWVMSGTICCRQPILRLAPYADIIMSPDIIRTVPYPKRPFQGWRYLRIEDAPPDLEAGANENSAEIAAELARMGLL